MYYQSKRLNLLQGPRFCETLNVPSEDLKNLRISKNFLKKKFSRKILKIHKKHDEIRERFCYFLLYEKKMLIDAATI